ncbi:Short chain dehydrogenase sirQ [Colletotrichum fructicola]|nr:Short chain dehydrogenase sirQ [Colletotrichum fructicola]KAF4904030.1 Short chain dehydrogenase sirQ [Colletotrichum fructicola]KAF4926107.1 Short chain dehydrogenase sirQ [Colletotrichum fructicola]
MEFKKTKGNVALVFGASGISGWALMRECLNYPSTKTLPEDSRLKMRTGLDLTNAESTLRRLGTISDIAAVTHVYFVAYTGHGTTPENLVELNSAIVDNALMAVNVLCPNVNFVSLQTGGKGYGMVGHGWPPAPWKETLPRIPEPYASKIFYYAQHYVVARHAAASSWKWAEIRPSFLDLVARFHIHVSLHPEDTNGRAFNVGDGEPVSWQMKWPLVCNYFGLEGVGPQEQATGQAYGIDWLMAQKDSWPVWVAAHGLQPNAMDDVQWDILVTTLATPIRIDYDLTASREIEFCETLEPGKGYTLAFGRLQEANFLPDGRGN